MCGIVGFWSAKDSRYASGDIRAMADAIAHRGPDDEGIWADEREGLFLGQRRLSIVDLAGGHQPMQSDDGRYVITFNGEI